jgi:GT2 family glycosyltransferase
MQASIIIPSKDRQHILLHSLAFTVRAVEHMQVEIIIVNDGSSAIPIPAEWRPVVSVIQNTGKGGVASARNTGARHAVSDLLIFLDDDMLVHEAAIKRIIGLAEKHPDDTININWVYPPELLRQILKTKFGRYLHHYGFTTLKGWNHDQPWNDRGLFENIGITSQFLAIHKKTFYSVNGYDESFPHAGFEDYDFAKRLKAKGALFFIWPDDTVYHNETDRLDALKWLQRKERGGETRKIAVMRGNAELRLYYAGVKKFILSFLAATRGFWIAVLRALPNVPWLDPLYGRLANVLLAASIFKGYTKIRH